MRRKFDNIKISGSNVFGVFVFSLFFHSYHGNLSREIGVRFTGKIPVVQVENYDSHKDIAKATQLANDAVNRFAMGKDPILCQHNPTQHQAVFTMTNSQSSQALQIIKECETEAFEILERNELLLLKLTEYLTLNSRIEKEMIQKIVEEFSADRFVKEEGFKDINH